MKKILLTMVLAVMPMLAVAHSYTVGDINIGHAWMRAVPKSATVAAAYVPLLNNGKTDDALIGASGTWFERMEIHETKMQHDRAQMHALPDELILPVGKPVAMRPQGLHLMFFGVKGPIEKGVMQPITLEFKNAGKVDITLQVEAIGAAHSGH